MKYEEQVFCQSDIGYMIDRLCPLVFACANNTTDLSHKCFLTEDYTHKMLHSLHDKYDKVKNCFLECSLLIVGQLAEYQEELYNIV